MISTKLRESCRTRLLEEKTKILNGDIMKNREDLDVTSEALADEGDIASNLVNQQITFNLRHREIQKLRLIEDALARIESEDYGLCEDCDEPIEEKRILSQPWTILCITHAEEKERSAPRIGMM